MAVRHTIPLLPLRGILIYPTMTLHIDVGRERSVFAIEHAIANDNVIFLATQIDMNEEDPEPGDLYQLGTLALVKSMTQLPNGAYRVLIEGIERATWSNYEEADLYPVVSVSGYPDSTAVDAETEALMRTLLDHFKKYTTISKRVNEEAYDSVSGIQEPGRLADTIASYLPLKIRAKQDILETRDVNERLEWLISRLFNEQEVMNLEQRINERVREAMERTQKEFYLREQMKAIQTELGDKDGKGLEVESLREKIEEAGMPEEVQKTAERELNRFEKIPSAAPESGIIRSYIDWLLALPWSDATVDQLDIDRSEMILNRDHEGLDTVKERILEFLSVRQLTKSLRGPILCIEGPPGVGKTSLAKSIAESLDRKFVRISLGGVRDESEIRGHRRTYVGAMPGRIIQGMKKAGTINPVFLLDEIDKMSNDFRGDPSSAMLEVLDPEQNSAFSDHYIEEPYDLSNVLFIATANDLSSIPGPLRDRMEIISIAGYTELEKQAIAARHLIPKQLKEHGLTKSQVKFQQPAILDLVRFYTREAGVRSLQREIARICRKSARIIAGGKRKSVTVSTKTLETFLGKRKFSHGQAEETNQVGVATGLAYTSVGGDTLQIEVSLSPGKGKLILTGKLGDVMKESAQTALSYVRSRAESLGIDPLFYETNDIHIHVPQGAVPKDGPSAGVTIATALVSALTNRPIRKEVGMTGEITLRGRVLPIGGLKEKTLSAHRAGLRVIILPKDNERDIDDVPEEIRSELTFKLADDAEQVLEIALEERSYESTQR
ncbi:Lon protease 1 [Sporosarcina sp. NCCP-2716]|uniref:endopeptidase La n=1 Tax=Sporosarcina sp. NCCP-2716 TaxID=2943679 RepID=UPI002085A25C|nr:endopeptidase La [Sporosarcina sp. NCCP-2716]GKV68814.1 Lon protease 1 [Sporosarcina sp. NCCP-2716]